MVPLLPFVVLLFVSSSTRGYEISFDPSHVDELYVDDRTNVTAQLEDWDAALQRQILDGNVTAIGDPDFILSARLHPGTLQCSDNNTCNVTVELQGKFLGYGNAYLARRYFGDDRWVRVSPKLAVKVLRRQTTMNHAFIGLVAVLLAINHVNMGCAIETDVVIAVLKKPIAPLVGFGCQFLIMPLLSYGFGRLLFEDPSLRLGLFTFGCSPGGGASNMWTVILGGNLHLSITMTFVSTLASLGTLPLWMFSLGRTIIKDTNITIPYLNIVLSLVSLSVPIGIGLLIQRCLPNLAAKSKKILAPLCLVMIISIVVLACISNYYMLQMLTWRMLLAACLNVFGGFAVGFVSSKWCFRFPDEDVVAVSVETGIQNSGIAFVLLSYLLEHPAAEIASVVPVAGSIVTPIPLFLVYFVRTLRNCCFRRDKFEMKSTTKQEMTTTKNGYEDIQGDVKY